MATSLELFLDHMLLIATGYHRVQENLEIPYPITKIKLGSAATMDDQLATLTHDSTKRGYSNRLNFLKYVNNLVILLSSKLNASDTDLNALEDELNLLLVDYVNNIKALLDLKQPKSVRVSVNAESLSLDPFKASNWKWSSPSPYSLSGQLCQQQLDTFKLSGEDYVEIVKEMCKEHVDVLRKEQNTKIALAQAYEKEQKYNEQKKDSAQKKKQIELLEAVCVQKTKQIEELEDIGTQQTKQIEVLEDKGALQTKQIEALEDISAQQTKQIEVLEDISAQKDKEIEELKLKLEEAIKTQKTHTPEEDSTSSEQKMPEPVPRRDIVSSNGSTHLNKPLRIGGMFRFYSGNMFPNAYSNLFPSSIDTDNKWDTQVEEDEGFMPG